MDIVVRQAEAADLDALVPLFDGYRQFYGQRADPAAARDFLSARFRQGESVVFIAHAGDAAVGFTQLYPLFSSVSMVRTFLLNDLFVCEGGRRNGVGAQLLEAAAAFARGQGAHSLTLSTAVANTQAQALYDSRGWQREQSFHVYNLVLRD